MISTGFLAWILFCYQVSCRPLSSDLENEDEKVTRCIVEVISDTLSKPYPLPVSSECSKILKEDARILAMVRHQNLLKELEELTHHEETRESLAKKSNKRWNYPVEESVKWNGENNMERQYMLDKKGASAERRDDVSHRREANTKKDIPLKRGEDMEKYEESEEENLKEQHDFKVMNGEDDTKIVMHESEEELSDEDKRSSEKRHRESSEESKEDEQEDHDILKIDELIEKIAREELEDEEDKRANEKKHHSKEYSSEEDDFKKRNEEARSNVKKRVEENASDEETDQFEAEEKGVKIFDSKTHQHETGDKHSIENKSQDDKRHHFLEDDMDSDNDLDYLEKRHHNTENSEEQDEKEEEEEEIEEEQEEEEEEEEEHKLKNLVVIEKELKKVAKKLRDIRRG
ncbi:chromogranin-A-like [Carcharodon carcharias]|uniref:chromogranin-A-like n=1 Tax=Carcharodon carcharias TaxID=13397 RepID=UPI001B7F6622|nr:chromogranin-A-like [Carcharodon carcharias]